MSPIRNSALNAPESSRPRKILTQKKSKAFKQRKIPKALDKVASNIALVFLIFAYQSRSLYVFTEPRSTILLTATQRKSCSPNLKLPMDPKTSCYYSIKPPFVTVSESLAPSSLHGMNPQDTANLISYVPLANFDHPQFPVSTRMYRAAEPSHDSPDFNNQSADDILSSTNNPCQSCGRYDPPRASSSTGSLSMECAGGVDPYQFEQLSVLDSTQNIQHFIDSFIPQPQRLILPYVSNVSSIFPGNSHDNSHDIYAEITGSPESHLTMTSANDGTTFSLPNYDVNNPKAHSYYM